MFFHALDIIVQTRLWRTAPRLVGLFLSGEGNPFHHSLIAIIASRQVIGSQVRTCPIDIAIGVYGREPYIHGKSIVYETRSCPNRMFMRIERPKRIVDLGIWLWVEAAGLDVDTGAKSTGSIGRRAHPSLN